MEILSEEQLQEQKTNFLGKKYRKSIIQIERILLKNELFECSFVYQLLIIQQKSLTKLLNKNIFKKNPYSLSKARYIIDLANRNNSVLLYIVSKTIEQKSNFALKQTAKVFQSNDPSADIIIQKIIDCKNLSLSPELFFENFLLVVVACINTLKRYDAYLEAYETARFCYTISSLFYFPQNITIRKRVLEVKIIYGCMLFQLGEYQEVKKIQDEVVNGIIGILCCNHFVKYKQNEKKKQISQNFWRKLLVSIMINLSSSIHSKNYQNICEQYKLFASAARECSRLESMTFRKCITYVLDSIGVILHQHTDVMDEIKELLEYLFQKIDAKAKQKNHHRQNCRSNTFHTCSEISEDSTDFSFVDMTKQKNGSSKIKQQSFYKLGESRPDVLNTSISKQRMKIIKNFIDKDASFVAPFKWKENNFFKTKESTLNYLGTISPHTNPQKQKNNRRLNRRGQFLSEEVKKKLANGQKQSKRQIRKQAENEKEKTISIKKQSNQYSKMIKRQFQLKYRQSKTAQSNQDDFINIAQMKRNIKETDKFIEYSTAQKYVHHRSNSSSIYFEAEQDCKQEGIPLFVKTILGHKQFLGIPKLFEKHEMIERKRQNINKKKVEKKHKSMSARRTSKFENAQLTNLLRSSFTNYVSNPRSKKPRNIRESVGVIVNNRIMEYAPGTRKPVVNLTKQNQYSNKLKKVINFNYQKSQQIIKKFSSQIQSEIRNDEAPKQKLSVLSLKSGEWDLSHKYYKLGKTIMNNSFITQQK